MLALHILSLVVLDSPFPQSTLASLSLVSRAFADLAQPLLFLAPCVYSLKALDALLVALEDARFSGRVRRFRVHGRVFSSKGYGLKLSRVLRACRVERLEVIGVDDLRPKHLVGAGALTHLSLLNSSFRPHSHVCPPSLPTFLTSLTHLTLSNLGLPSPSTHPTVLLQQSSRTLEYLAISSLRDVDLLEFRRVAQVLVSGCKRLQTLVLGFLTDEQVEALCLPLLSTPGDGHASVATPHSRRPALSLLSHLTSLTFTLPHPSLLLLVALPPSLLTLTIRPPYGRSFSHQGSHIFGTSKSALLSVLNPVPTPAGSGTATPATANGAGSSRRRPSVSLEQLEEEEEVLMAVEAALGVHPPALRAEEAREGVAADGEGNGGMVAPKLQESTPLVCAGHTRPVPSLHFSPLLASSSSSEDPNYLLISACKDGKPMLRDWLGDWQGTFTGDTGHKGAVWSARLSQDGALAVTASADFTAKLWDATTGHCLTTLPHSHVVRTADLSPPSSSSIRILTGGHEKRLRLWDLARAPRDGGPADPRDGVDEFRAEGGGTAHEGTVKKVLWDEERRACVSMGEDKVVRWWDLRTLQMTHEVSFNNDPITSMEKSHDGELLAITSGKDVTFLSLDSRLPYLTHTLAYAPSTASLHPLTRATFVTGSTTDEWVRVHDARSGKELEVGKGHHGPVHCVEYSPDGELYATGSEDGTVRLWQTAPKTYGLWRYNEVADGGAA
ncbi:hypothetical protein JCM1841_000572 [Sporobolomyces salmonicolor]